MIGIYKITNKINGKCYIGQSDNIKRRWKNHKKDAFWKKGASYEHPLYRAMRKYGIDNFSFQVLDECSKSELDDKEIYYISKYNSYENGYNLTRGGRRCATVRKLSDNDVKAIIQRLKTSIDNMFMIADEFGVHWTTIRTINAGLSRVQEGECYPIRPDISKLCLDENGGYKFKERGVYTCRLCGTVVSEDGCVCRSCARKGQRRVDRPSSLELAKMVKEQGFTQTGKMFGVSGNAIKRWCKTDGIPTKLKDLMQWYNNQMGIVDPPPKIKRPKSEITRPVNQIDRKTGQVLMRFDSLGQACKAVNGTNLSHISAVCKGLRKSAYGYFWQFA